MKTYQEFKEAVEEQFVNYMAEVNAEYKDYRIIMETTKKVNETLDGFSVVPKNDSSCVSPRFYVQNVYNLYREHINNGFLEEEAFVIVMRTYSEKMICEMRKTGSIICDVENILKDKDLFENNLILQVIGKVNNQELLKEVPNRIVYDDLAVIYRVRISLDNEDSGTFIVTNKVLENYGVCMSEQELFDIALKNTLEFNPIIEGDMQDVLRSMGMPEEVIKEYEGAEPAMYIVRAAQECYGAYAVLCPENFESIAEKVGGDLFIIPSSIHEVICIRYDEEQVESTLNMVREVNTTQLLPEEILSYSLYRYKKDEKAIERIKTRLDVFKNEMVI